MTNAAYLLAALRCRGFALRAENGKIMVTPVGSLTPGDRAEIAEYRADLLVLLEDGWTDEDRYVARMSATGAWAIPVRPWTW